jgi:predicted transcriptional regulator
MDLSDSAYWRQIYPQPVEKDKESHKRGYETESQVTSQAIAEIEEFQAKFNEAHQRIEQLLRANQCSQKKLAAVELLNQFIEEAGVGEKIKHPSTNRTLGYLAKFQKWLGQLPSE